MHRKHSYVCDKRSKTLWTFLAKLFTPLTEKIWYAKVWFMREDDDPLCNVIHSAASLLLQRVILYLTQTQKETICSTNKILVCKFSKSGSFPEPVCSSFHNKTVFILLLWSKNGVFVNVRAQTKDCENFSFCQGEIVEIAPNMQIKLYQNIYGGYEFYSSFKYDINVIFREHLCHF